MMSPACAAVRALKFLTKSMILTPAWPRAGPIGGAGVAAPAGICSLIIPTTFLAIFNSPGQFSRGGACPHPGGGLSPPLRQAQTALQLLDLREIELDRRLPAEDRHHHLERVAVEVHLV